MKGYRYKERRDRMIRKVGFVVGEIVLAIALAFVGVHYCFQTDDVHGESMQPAYYDGDIILVNKLEYLVGNPSRLDPVVIELENGTTSHYTVKRVIGLPGETVQITDGNIMINGKKLDYSFEEDILSAGLAAYTVNLDDDEYFVMGDNCNNSEDSRVANIGNIQRSQFIGKVAGVLKKGDREVE